MRRMILLAAAAAAVVFTLQGCECCKKMSKKCPMSKEAAETPAQPAIEKK